MGLTRTPGPIGPAELAPPSAAATGSELVSLHVFEANEYEATEIRLVKALP